MRLADGRVTSAPIKGTATVPSGLTSKDEAENVMITDLVRNDLQRVCEPGTVEVTHLLELQEHPGLVHLVSTVAGDLRAEVPTGADPWGEILDALYPPASVSGAPKLAALRVIGELEPVPRGPYCGAFGWIDADANRAELAVAIRTFWWDPADGGRLTQARGQRRDVLQVEVEVWRHERLGRQAAEVARGREREAEEAARRDDARQCDP